MTTTIKLETHGWPVRVTTIDKMDEGVERTTSEVIAGDGQKRMYSVFQTRSILFEELPPEKPGEAPVKAPAAD